MKKLIASLVIVCSALLILEAASASAAPHARLVRLCSKGHCVRLRRPTVPRHLSSAEVQRLLRQKHPRIIAIARPSDRHLAHAAQTITCTATARIGGGPAVTKGLFNLLGYAQQACTAPLPQLGTAEILNNKGKVQGSPSNNGSAATATLQMIVGAVNVPAGSYLLLGQTATVAPPGEVWGTVAPGCTGLDTNVLACTEIAGVVVPVG
jgi:hypothetical protein